MRAFIYGVSLAALSMSAAPAWSQAAAEANTLDELIVTATRQSQPLSKAPVSVVAYSQEMLDAKGVRSIDDLSRVTPGIQFSRQGFGSGNRSFISIRGVRSSVGAATTGIYIDDTPIQTRTARQATNTNAYPQVFDLERIEVLRGPQGTLFGAGAQGGAIRFITPDPNFTEVTGYGRADASTTRSGGASYEAGLGVGGPIIEDKLAFRVSAWARHDGGYVDRVERLTGQVLDKNANTQNSLALRAAVGVRLGEALTLTPSVFYQTSKADDAASYWVSLSDVDKARLRNGNAVASPFKDRFVLPALKAELDLGSVELISNTSYFDRKGYALPDHTEYVSLLVFGTPYLNAPAYGVSGRYINQQKTFTQELRLQSTDQAARLTWVAGAFYSRARQNDTQAIDGAGTARLLADRLGVTVTQAFGRPLYQGLYTYYETEKSVDQQTAMFGQVDYKLMPKLKLTAGLRVARAKFDFASLNAGPYSGPETRTAGDSSETPVTPKFGISYQRDDDNLFYGSVAKGYRVGGAQAALSLSSCASNLADLGLSAAPKTYKSDSLWSYELGAKNRLAGGRIQLDSSVFYIDWSNIQGRVSLPCGLGFMTNLGSATSKGFDVASTIKAAPGLTLNLGVSYVDASYDETIRSGTRTLIKAGQRVADSPWSASASALYEFQVAGREAFARVDYQYRSQGKTPPVEITSLATPTPELSFASVRAGVKVRDADVSLYVDNVFNAHPQSISHESASSPLYLGLTSRPRTTGVTVSSRF